MISKAADLSPFIAGLLHEAKEAAFPIADTSMVFRQVQRLRSQSQRATEAIKKTVPNRGTQQVKSPIG